MCDFTKALTLKEYNRKVADNGNFLTLNLCLFIDNNQETNS